MTHQCLNYFYIMLNHFIVLFSFSRNQKSIQFFITDQSESRLATKIISSNGPVCTISSQHHVNTWNLKKFPGFVTTKVILYKSCDELKFIYSEKATKFCEIFILLLSCVVPVKSKVKILQNLAAFSEYMNFMYVVNSVRTF